MFLPFPDIEQFHQVMKTVRVYPQYGTKPATYRGKVKLHGTNAAVQIRYDNRVLAQSRSSIISIGNDNAGFAAWVEAKKDLWLTKAMDKTVTIFGEWAGPGIQKGVAVNQIPRKSFFVFAVFVGNTVDETEVILEPDEIAKYLPEGLDDVYVLPWATEQYFIDWNDEEAIKKELDAINEMVVKIDENDHYIEGLFGVKGHGEGYVFYPDIPAGEPNRLRISTLTFKAKGEKHKVIKTKVAAQIDPEKVKSIDEFVELFLTPARLEQGVRAISRGEMVFEQRLIGPFIGWVGKDVEKESKVELDEAGLTWKDVASAVSTAARKWYMSQI